LPSRRRWGINRLDDRRRVNRNPFIEHSSHIDRRHLPSARIDQRKAESARGPPAPDGLHLFSQAKSCLSVLLGAPLGSRRPERYLDWTVGIDHDSQSPEPAGVHVLSPYLRRRRSPRTFPALLSRFDPPLHRRRLDRNRNLGITQAKAGVTRQSLKVYLDVDFGVVAA